MKRLNPIQNPKSKIQNPESGQASLVALLVGVALIGLLVWVFLFRKSGKETATEKEARGAIVTSNKKTTVGAALDQATGVECQNNLSQLRQAISMEKMSDEESPLPQTLNMLKGISGSMKACPAGGRPYFYDPRTGQVRCTTPGHERL